MLVLLIEKIYEGINSYDMIYIPSFMKIGTCVKAILRFCLRNLSGRTIGITVRRCFFNYAVEMGSGAVIHVSSFIKIGSGIQKLMGGGDTQKHRHTHTHTEQGDLISLLLFLQNKESRLKKQIKSRLNLSGLKIKFV
jgi:hypothetical protein